MPAVDLGYDNTIQKRKLDHWMKPDQVSSIFWMVFSVIIIYASYKLGLGSLAHPRPGLLPFLSGVVLFAVSIIVFLRGGISTSHEKAKGIRQLWEGMNWSKTIIVTIALVLYTLLFSHLGFLLSTILLLIFLLRAIEPVRWFVAIGGSMIVSFVSFAIFVLWLQVQLPKGIIERFCF